jgi:hypothetical protein
MTTDSRVNDVAAYAAAVRGALGDLAPEENTALLEDLEDHLAEIAAEADGTLAERLGTPEQYAAELRAAYGAAHSDASRREPGLPSAVAGLAGRLYRSGWYAAVRSFLPSLRPAWWVFRAYSVVLILTALFSSGDDLRPIPSPFHSRGLLQLIATAVAIVFSVRLGYRGRSRARAFRVAGVLANAAIALFAIRLLGSMSTFPGSSVSPDVAATVGFPGAYANGPTTNIYPYSHDGKALKDVLLYDQDGQPLAVDGRGSDLTTSSPVGADGLPITNAYPLSQRHLDGTAVAAPRVAIPPWPSSSSAPSASATP